MSSESTKIFFLGIVLPSVLFLSIFLVNPLLGVGGWGPENSFEATITEKHVDANGSAGSHYMVTTDQGTFEVDNGFILGVWNSDEIYGKMEVGKTYRITTKGNKYVNFVLQEYPYIVAAEELK